MHVIGPLKSIPKRELSLFRRFCRAHRRVQQTDRQPDRTTSLATGRIYADARRCGPITGPCSASSVGFQRDAARVSAERRAAAPLLLSGVNAGACCTAPAAIDRYLQPTGRSAANPPHAASALDRWDRHTDRRTDTRPLSAYYASA